NRGTLKLDGLRAVVLDEADEMLRMGFVDDVEAILQHAPEERQVALFSATMPRQIAGIAHRHLRNPVEIKIVTKTSTVETITQRYWQVRGIHKLDALTRMLEVEEFDAIIVFVRTKTATMDLAEKLEARGFASSALNGDMNQAQREQTVERLRNGGLDIVVATDVAARGLDVERITHVINYDIPTDTEAYVHRIGRTGRAGRKGQAILFVSPRERRLLYAIEKATRQPIAEMTLPTHDELQDKRVGRFKEMVLKTIESEELEGFEQIVTDLQSESDIGLSEIAAALAWLAQKDRPLKGFESSEKPAYEESSAPRRPQQRSVTEHAPEEGMRSYRVDVGRRNGLKPGNIVGAIANEADLEAKKIGHIKILDFHSFVDLPEDLDATVLDHLRTVWVCGRELNIQPADSAEVNAAPQTTSRPRSDSPKRDRDRPRGPKARSGGDNRPPRGNKPGGRARSAQAPTGVPANAPFPGDVPVPGTASFNEDNFGNTWDYNKPQQRRTGGGGPGRNAGGAAGRNPAGGRGRGRKPGGSQGSSRGNDSPGNRFDGGDKGNTVAPYVGDYQKSGGFAPVPNANPTLATKSRSKRIDPNQIGDTPPPRKSSRTRTPGKLTVSTKRNSNED
ncbi:MAG: DbpA RNA binding domain-containing protein, partial [Gammaproteobacteria bacterium]|nr:DbpA RNA binding domain-containing protein [Gammaproteobacteria bacterium]